jgi:hypothetical protein
MSSADSKPHSMISTMPSMDGTIRLFETPESRDRHVSNLQNRASQHLESIVDLLVKMAPNIETEQKSVWKGIIVQLVREVVAFVDPDVRAGDSLDIRPYVKLKIIPGGTLEENAFVNGVVFRKNVAHKKMSSPRTNPRILLLGGGIDFQREDWRLSSLETLIEQEDRYTEILVDKILALKPNVILVGKSVARRAQEMLCEKNVVVMQSVKTTLLERIARMTGAIMLSSTDHMIQQYGEECLGSCEKFHLRKIIDCEWDEFMPKKRSTPLKRITKDQQGVTYAYLEGCPAELGGTIILRGSNRKVLSEVKRIISFGIMLAYHLRLEVSYYTDRCARLPEILDVTKSEYESDDEHVEPSLLIKPSVTDEDAKRFMCQILSEAEERSLLSTSLDVDITLPHSTDVRGTNNVHIKAPIDSVTPEDYQTLLVTSLVMTHNYVQRARAEVKGIRFYTAQDVALGQFLVESCFQLPSLRSSGRIMMLDHILSFVHRTGRIDISVSRVGGSDIIPADPFESQTTARDPLQAPIMMHSFCKECKAIVTPDVLLSDETWKMSFGKFMEMNFYNRSARCRTGGCAHYIRDDHVLFFLCEGYSARFEFVPIHPYSLHIRTKSALPTDFHDAVTLNFLNEYSLQSDRLFNDFAQVLASLERLVTDVLGSRSEVLTLALSDIKMIETDIQTTLEGQQEVINCVMDLMSGGRTSLSNDDDSLPEVVYSFPKKFPLRLRRELLQKATNWNAKIDVVYRFIDSLESMNQAANAAQQQSSVGNNSISELPDDDELMNLRASLMQMSVTELGDEEDLARDAAAQDDHTEDFQEKRPLIKGTGTEDKRASTRFVKAFARLLGKDSLKQSNFAVDISDFSGGRLGLPPGRGGRVIGVVEDELSTVIAYSLSSQEYWEQIQAYLREDTNDLIVKERPYKNEILSSPADFEQSNENDLGGSHIESKIDYSEDLTLDNQRERSETSDALKALDESHSNPADVVTIKKRKSTFAKTFQTLVKSDVPEPQPSASAKEGAEQEETESENPEGMFGFMSFHSTGDYFEYGDQYVIGGLGNNGEGEGKAELGSAPALSAIQEAPANCDNEQEPNIPGERASPQPISSRESILTDRRKTHIKHRFSDFDDKNNITCKFICHVYWAMQFQALRAEFLDDDEDEGFIRSLSLSSRWNAQGGKSGASFSRTTDNRFVVKHITRTELQMFLEFAPAYFDYMAKAFYHGLPTTLCKILGVYQIGYHNRATGKKVMEQVVVMENLFFEVMSLPSPPPLLTRSPEEHHQSV